MTLVLQAPKLIFGAALAGMITNAAGRPATIAKFPMTSSFGQNLALKVARVATST